MKYVNFNEYSSEEVLAMYHEKQDELNSLSVELKYFRPNIPWKVFVENNMLDHAAHAHRGTYGSTYVESAAAVVEYKIHLRDFKRRQFVFQLAQLASK